MTIWSCRTAIVGEFKNHLEAFEAAKKKAFMTKEIEDSFILKVKNVKLEDDAPEYGTIMFDQWECTRAFNMSITDPCVAVEIKGFGLKKLLDDKGMLYTNDIKAYVFIGLNDY